MLIIGLGHLKRVGKDTFYNIISQKYPHLNIKRLAFADLLKTEIYNRIFIPSGIPYELIESNKDVSRPLLQAYGEFMRQAVDKNYWINAIDCEIKSTSDDSVIYIITDLRYQNELKWLRSVNGVYIKINRNIENNDLHSSEVDMIGIESDYTLYNNSTLCDYEKCVIELFGEIIAA